MRMHMHMHKHMHTRIHTHIHTHLPQLEQGAAAGRMQQRHHPLSPREAGAPLAPPDDKRGGATRAAAVGERPLSGRAPARAEAERRQAAPPQEAGAPPAVAISRRHSGLQAPQ